MLCTIYSSKYDINILITIFKFNSIGAYSPEHGFRPRNAVGTETHGPGSILGRIICKIRSVQSIISIHNISEMNSLRLKQTK